MGPNNGKIKKDAPLLENSNELEQRRIIQQLCSPENRQEIKNNFNLKISEIKFLNSSGGLAAAAAAAAAEASHELKPK